jgi:hypothetical protein
LWQVVRKSIAISELQACRLRRDCEDARPFGVASDFVNDYLLTKIAFGSPLGCKRFLSQTIELFAAAPSPSLALTKNTNSSFAGWPGANHVDVAHKASQRLRTVLVEETLRRADGFGSQVTLPVEPHAWARNRLSPMVCGLFGTGERSIVLDKLARGVVFLTPRNIAAVHIEQTRLSTAWNLANLCLYSIPPCFPQQACPIVGLSEETTCYVSISHFDETDPFADFVVHEGSLLIPQLRAGHRRAGREPSQGIPAEY